jgi:hypothetical protein
MVMVGLGLVWVGALFPSLLSILQLLLTVVICAVIEDERHLRRLIR